MGSVPNLPEIPPGHPDLRRTLPGFILNLFAIGPRISKKEADKLLTNENFDSGDGLIFYDELCPFSKNLTKDS
jgi:hypothetical protein